MKKIEAIFIHLAIILGLAFLVSYLIKIFKQPIIIGYIIAGILISPFIFKFGASTEFLDTFSKFGIAFLLFIVGLHLNPKIIKEIGTSSLIIGLLQIIVTFIFGFAISNQVLSYGVIASIYIGIALAFSSTIIITKLISDKKQLDSLYGKISIGILIIQDLVAIGILMFISSTSIGISFGSLALRTLLAGGGLIVVLFLAGFFVLPGIIRNIAKSQELLFLFSICWCFVIAALFFYFGFSIEIGALIAGIVLSISPYSTEISSRIRPLRDFFLVIFFIILGLNINLSQIGSIIVNAFILSLIALFFKPIILMIFMALFGYTKRNNFLVGTTLAQISEFSLIILALGVAVGHISPELLTTLTLTGIITITLSTYVIIYSNNLYGKLIRFISFFERKKVRRKKIIRKNYDAILFGYNRIGFSILRALKKIKKKYLVVDYNPDIISDLTKLRVPSLYGDAFDPDFLDDLPLNKVKIIVSTVPDFETNLLLLESISLINPSAIVIVRAHTIEEALKFYMKGANYVLTPHFLGGEYLARMIKIIKTNEKGYKEEKIKHVRMLTERLKKFPKKELRDILREF
ncbi:MAG: cation:proton antiporter [Nanoarchaeota archaeon]|nr:cation:proton antiporter [Nanoarchaeota archaeon]MBU1028173.1 cation:proton antiporter [Nanoarchaeota archaeon]